MLSHEGLSTNNIYLLLKIVLNCFALFDLKAILRSKLGMSLDREVF